GSTPSRRAARSIRSFPAACCRSAANGASNPGIAQEPSSDRAVHPSGVGPDHLPDYSRRSDDLCQAVDGGDPAHQAEWREHDDETGCHEGNYGLTGILAGARAKDREEAAGRTRKAATLEVNHS